MEVHQRGVAAAVVGGLLGLLSGVAQALPVVSQTGNLLSNGNFEAGSGTAVTSGLGVGATSALDSWLQYSNSASTTSSRVDAPLIEGDHSAHVQSGGLHDGLYQYLGLVGGSYTVSGWVYVLSGSVKLGVAWNSGFAAAYGTASTSTGQWEYLSTTVLGVASSTGGALVYGGPSGGDYYVEGLWLNAGESNLSPFSPSNGFVLPDATVGALPLPSGLALVLAGVGLIGASQRRRSRPSLRALAT